MPWVRIDENAMDHPKIGALPDGAFRLWVQALAYCQKHLTDGYVSDLSIRSLLAFSQKRREVLVAAGLWDLATSGIQVHDYLIWNDSRASVVERREAAKDRMKQARDRRSREVRANSGPRSPERAREVLRGVVCSEEKQLKPEEGSGETAAARAGDFCAWYADTHQRLVEIGYIGNPQKDYQAALQLVAKATDVELRDAAIVWFGCDDDFATSGTRTIPKFASRASWCLQQVKARGIA